MKIIYLKETLVKKINIDNLVIGHFNVVHKGHFKLFSHLENKSFLIFEDNPSKPYKLFNINERIENLKIFNPQYIFVFNILENNCTPIEFIENFLLKNLNIKNIIVGSDFKFGKDKMGDIKLLKNYFNVKEIINDKKISTSLIVELLKNGEVEKSNKLMLFNFYYTGIVVKGKGIAKKQFFPTANIIDNKNLDIKNGSYVSRTLYNNKWYPSISFIGIPKSIETDHKFIETYLFDFDKDIYGEKLKVEILNFIRENQKFNSFDELVKNINNDLSIAKEYLNKSKKE